MFHYLFFTGEKSRYVYQNPDATSTIREWKPALKAYPDIRYTMENITAGIVTISDTSYQLINIDSVFTRFTGVYDSFYQKAIDVWVCINDADNREKVYSGKCRSLTFSGMSVTLSVYDGFTAFQKTALMGSSYSGSHFLRKTGSYPNLKPDDHGKPISFVLGKSPLRVSVDYNSIYGLNFPYRLPESGLDAVCTSYSPIKATNTNRTWTLCRMEYAGIRSIVLGTFVRFLDGMSNMKYFYYTDHDIRIGQTLRLVISSVTHYGIVRGNGDFTKSGNTYNLAVEVLTAVFPAGQPTITLDEDVQVFLKRGGSYYPVVNYRDYTLYQYAFGVGSPRLIYLVLADNFEGNARNGAGATYGAALDPDSDGIGFACASAGARTHAEVLKWLVEQCGLTTNAASFTAADSALTALIYMAIPLTDESDFSDYRTYIEKILTSTLGYIRINTSNEVEYHLLAAPSSTNEINDDLYLDDVDCTIDYADIACEVVAENYAINDEPLLDSAQSPSQTSTSLLAKYLHGIEASFTLQHVLNRYDNRIADLLNIKSIRKAVYKISTATHNIDSQLGDDVKLISDRVIGGLGYDALKITSINISPTKTDIECDDLGGL